MRFALLLLFTLVVFTPFLVNAQAPPLPDAIAIYHNDNDAACFARNYTTYRLAWFDFGIGPNPDPMGWTSVDRSGRGDFADLHLGVFTLQEYPCFVPIYYLWGFFDDPLNTNYACHVPEPEPLQGTVPFSDFSGNYMYSEIWSPPIDITVGSGNEYVLEFRVYRDLPLDNLVFYSWAIRSRVGGVWGAWKNNGIDYYGRGNTARDWIQQRHEIGYLIDPGATEVQIALAVKDHCSNWCGIYGTGTCHSHAPLFDDVQLTRIDVDGPRWNVNPVHLFQDNFPDDGTITGTVRADAAWDTQPITIPGITPADFVTVSVADPVNGLATDLYTGIGDAVWCYLLVKPERSGLSIQAPETRAGVGLRFPFVGVFFAYGDTWYCFRMDNALDGGGSIIPGRYVFDLRDDVFTPGDVISFFFGARNTAGAQTYWYPCGVTDDIEEALLKADEFTCLPGPGWQIGGDILYVDDHDGHGSQQYFDQAFLHMGIQDSVDRFDVRAPEYMAGNSLGSRCPKFEQLTQCYRKIIWCSGDLTRGLVGNQEIGREKSPDFPLLWNFLHKHPDNPGIYFSGDNIAEEWSTLGNSAATLRADYMPFSLKTGDHTTIGEPLSPELEGVGLCFQSGGVPDELIAATGCPKISQFDRFDVFTGALTTPEIANPATGEIYLVSKTTPNNAGSTARVLLSGFSFEHIASKPPPSPPTAYSLHLYHALRWLLNGVPFPTAVPDLPVPTTFLANAYPNPFNATTSIRYGVETQAQVSLQVFDVSGRLVRTLVDETQLPQAEGYRVEWDGNDDRGTLAASGVYFYRLQAGSFTKTKKTVLLK